MPVPITLEQLEEEWSKDSEIDESRCGKDGLKTDKLVSKYVKYLSFHSIASKNKAAEYNRLRSIMHEYYTTGLTQEELNELGLKPFEMKAKDKYSVDRWLDRDEKLIAILLRKAIHDEAVALCQTILKSLAGRSYNIANFLTWQKISRGEM